MNLRRATIAALALLAGACSQFSLPEKRAALPAAGRYVALGSSFAAGPALGALQPGAPERCMRTLANYPARLAQQLRLTLTDVSCSGATTEHILGAWGELAPQIDAVTAETDIVTVTIGGNDLNYVGSLLSASCGPDGKMTIGSESFTCPPRQWPSEADYVRVEANLREIARQVRIRAPRARLVFVQYLTLVPRTLCAAAPLSEADAEAARAVGLRLAAITASVAQEAGAMLLPADELSRAHTPCDAVPWAVGFPRGYDGSQGAPWHPNTAGMMAVADALARQLGG